MRRWRCGGGRSCTTCATSRSPSGRSHASRRCAWPASAPASRPTSSWGVTSRCSGSSRRSWPSTRCASRCGSSSCGALNSSGRRAEALEAARAARKALADELGLAPSAELAGVLDGVEGEQALPARREVVCVAADVRCAEDVGPIDPEVLEEVMRCCTDEAATVLRRHGDPVVERLPDGLVAVFGIRASHEDDGLRAVRAATALQRRLVELESERVALDVRLGVTAGTALVTSHDALPSGDVVGAASRLARAADVGRAASRRAGAGAPRRRPVTACRRHATRRPRG